MEGGKERSEDEERLARSRATTIREPIARNTGRFVALQPRDISEKRNIQYI